MRKRIEVTPGFCILWALLLLVLPLRMLLAAGAAAVFHELCHALMIRLSGGSILCLTIGAGGMVMETAPMTPGREMLCALAGPLGSLLLVLLYPVFPLLSLCALIQGCFNLLPLYPLDGGRATACWLRMVGRERWMKAIESVILVFLLVVVIGLRMGMVAVLAWGMLAMRKIPCKDEFFAVQ